MLTNLLTNMVVMARFAIATNTPAFEQYAYHAMFTNARAVAMKWRLDQSLITTSKVSLFVAKPYFPGFGGRMVFDHRYDFGFHKSQFSDFHDEPFDAGAFLTDNVETNDAVQEKWMRMTNLVTLQKAQEIAESALQSLGLPMRKLNFKKPSYKGQYKYEWKDGVVRPLPLYRLIWETEENFCHVRVSGITSNVVHFSFSGPFLRSERPTNYFEMLGLPNNPIFVKRRLTPPGRPPEYEIYEPDPHSGL